MNIKVLRAKANLSQKEFGSRICVKGQTVQKYESGERNIPDTVKKLIQYEFAEFLPEEDRLYPEGAAIKPQLSNEEKEEYRDLKKENEALRNEVAASRNLQQIIELQQKNIELLEDQVRLYKQQLDLKDNRSQSA